MGTVKFSTEFLLSAVNLEMSKANESAHELTRLMSIGYLNSQTGLDVAENAKSHLMKAYDLLDRIDIPEAKLQRLVLAETIARQELIIARIRLSL